MPSVGSVTAWPIARVATRTSVGSVTARPIARVATRTSVGSITTRPITRVATWSSVGSVTTRPITRVATWSSVGSVTAWPIARVATGTSVGSVTARPIACVAAIAGAARRSGPLGIAARALGRRSVRSARRRPARSRRMGCRRVRGRRGRTRLLVLRRGECGYSEKNQQYGPFRQDVSSSVARIHSHSCRIRSSFVINPGAGRPLRLDKISVLDFRPSSLRSGLWVCSWVLGRELLGPRAMGESRHRASKSRQFHTRFTTLSSKPATEL